MPGQIVFIVMMPRVFMVHLIKQLQSGNPVESYYIVTDDLPTRQHTVLRWVAEQLGLPIPEGLPEDKGGKRLNNEAMRATGFALRYPDFKVGYAALLSSQTS